MTDYDAIIIGAGHNGLICANYLAKGGKKVLILEASDTIGGLASTREFHPGFKVSVAHSINQFSSKIARDLNLASHGYKLGDAMATVGLSETGDHATLKDGKVSGVSDKDAASFTAYMKMMKLYAKTLKPFSLKTIPRIGMNSLSEITTFAKMGIKLRMLGKKDMRELMRIITLPTRDLMDENFDNDLLKTSALPI